MQQKSTALEYIADYRTADSHANKVTVKANAKSSHIETHLEGALPINVDTISTSKLATKKIGLYRVVFACTMLILAIAGATGLISALVRTTAVMSNSPTNTKCESYIAPVVMYDPPPFEDCNHLDTNVKVAESIWRNIFQNGSSTYKELDTSGLPLVPTRDVKSACTELFRHNATINTNESVCGQFFSHTTRDDYFHIGAISNAGSLVPYIEDNTGEDDALSLAVSHLTRDDKYFNDGSNKSYIQSVPKPCP